jgi:Asp-tRNA(Asn)/Glu-tRNA(Gln) amidotransferase A subunit family amidase
MPEVYYAAIRWNLQQGSKVTTAAYIQSRRELDEARRAIATVFSKVDLLVTPTTGGAAAHHRRLCVSRLNLR